MSWNAEKLADIFKTGNYCIWLLYTAISRKDVAKSARDNPERYCGWFWIHCCPKKFKKRIREATDVCLRELKESNKSRFDSYSVKNSVLIISHITFRDCLVHIFSDNLSRNSWMLISSSQFLFVVLFLSIRKVEVETNNNHTRRDIYNVIAVLRGSVEPGGCPCA